MKKTQFGLKSILALVAMSLMTGYTWRLQDPFFLSKTDFNIASALPPPPVKGSAQDKSDFAKLFKYQKGRTAQDCERASYEVEVSLEHLFGPKYGPLSEIEVKKWEAFFDKVRNDTDYFVQPMKKKWNRSRPYVAEPKIEPCLKREVTPAYPSGHAAISRVFADLLEQLDPKRRDDFEARANQISEDRIIGGVHHPADIEAGKKLGEQIFKKLMHNPEFEKELEASKN